MTRLQTQAGRRRVKPAARHIAFTAYPDGKPRPTRRGGRFEPRGWFLEEEARRHGITSDVSYEERSRPEYRRQPRARLSREEREALFDIDEVLRKAWR